MSYMSDQHRELQEQGLGQDEPGEGDMPESLSTELPEQLEPDMSFVRPMSVVQAEARRVAATIPSVRAMSHNAVAAMLADVFAGVPGFRLAKHPRTLERSFPREGR